MENLTENAMRLCTSENLLLYKTLIVDVNHHSRRINRWSKDTQEVKRRYSHTNLWPPTGDESIYRYSWTSSVVIYYLY